MLEGIIWEQVFVGAVVLGVFVAFLKEWFPPDVTAVAAFVIFLVTGMLDAEDASGVFGNSAPIIVACMFVLSGALERTGTIEALGGWFERAAGKKETRIILVMALLVIPLSAFVNNTPVVVVLMPIVIRLCRKLGLMASRFLIPLSYAAIVGGTCTIIGTSTNVVATSTAADIAGTGKYPSLEEPFGMLEIMPLGLAFVAITMVYLLTIGRKLLPDRTSLASLIESEEGKEFLTEARVADNSPLVGKLFTETPLSKMRRDLRLIEVRRDGILVQTALNKVRFRASDLLLFKSRPTGVVSLKEMEGISFSNDDDEGTNLGLEDMHTETAVLMEGIVGPRSRLLGRTLKELKFRQRFGVLILAVHRRGVNLRERFEDVRLAFGDTLLVEGPPDQMRRLFTEKDFINLSVPRERPFRRSKAPFAIGAIAIFMVFGALGTLPFLPLALAAVVIVVATRAIEPNEAYESIEWRVVLLIFGMLGVGRAVAESGLAASLAVATVSVFEGYGEIVVLSVVYLLAAILTELISNTAVAALLVPVAAAVAVALGCDARPFVVAIMFGASASFSTPIGYQTNTLVYGAGGYKFGDFARVGLPLAILLWIVATFLIPILWPLHGSN